ncbi:MAG: hypothetical protein KF716_24095 [Anaerolineae bacterium]|nr:hypothetical protein [Anaerolineae bacterium]
MAYRRNSSLLYSIPEDQQAAVEVVAVQQVLQVPAMGFQPESVMVCR